MISQFTLDPAITHLNHGSFGATPKVIQDAHMGWEREMELNPTAFYLRRLPELLNHAREKLAEAMATRSEKLAFVGNTTSGITQIARGLPIPADATVLTTSLGYGAANRAWEFTAQRRGARYHCLEIPFPHSADNFLAVLESALDQNVAVVCLDHITSASAVVAPIEQACTLIREKAPQAKVVIDGAHGPGMAELEHDQCDFDFYVGNLHKWFCAPKTCGFVWAAEGTAALDPLVVSWGWNADDDFPFGSVHDWKGTEAFGQVLTIPQVLQFQQEVDWQQRAEQSRSLAQQFRTRYHEASSLPPLCSAEDILQMAAVPYPWQSDAESLRRHFLDVYGVQFNAAEVGGQMTVRASFHLYNTEADLDRALVALRAGGA